MGKVNFGCAIPTCGNLQSWKPIKGQKSTTQSNLLPVSASWNVGSCRNELATSCREITCTQVPYTCMVTGCAREYIMRAMQTGCDTSHTLWPVKMSGSQTARQMTSLAGKCPMSPPLFRTDSIPRNYSYRSLL